MSDQEPRELTDGDSETRGLGDSETLVGMDPAAPGGDSIAAYQVSRDGQLHLLSDEELGIEPRPAGVNPEDAPLTERQKAFVKLFTTVHFLKGTPAARDAGYEHPHVAQNRLLKYPNVRKAIDAELEDILGVQASRNAIVLKLAAIKDGDLAEFSRACIERGIDPDNLTMADLAVLPPEITAAIKSINISAMDKTTEREGKGGKTTIDESSRSVNVQLHDANAAAALLTKILSYVEERVDVTSGGKALPAGAGGTVEIVVRREPTGIALTAGGEE